jgi:kinetochor protein Mis14/NSL1
MHVKERVGKSRVVPRCNKCQHESSKPPVPTTSSTISADIALRQSTQKRLPMATSRTDDSKDFRKIELQSPEDLRYLLSQAERVALQKVDSRLPPGTAEESERERVKALVLQYVHATFSLAQPNITINGLPSLPIEDYQKPVDEYEPFDARLNEEVATLHAKVEQRILDNAKLRRSVPAVVARGFETAVKEEERKEGRLARAWEKTVEERVKAAQGDFETLGMGAEVDAQAEKRAREGLKSLKRRFPDVAGKLERADKAAGFVVENAEGK